MQVPVTKSAKSVRWLLIISLVITQLDSGIISTNLSSMARSLSLMPQQKGWVVAIYTIGLLLATPIMGSLIDRLGYRFVFLTELGLYFVGVIGIAISHSFGMLVASRLIQAFGSSSLLTLVISLVFATEGKKVGQKVGSVGAWVAFSTIIAPMISVFSLVKTHDWRFIYFVLAGLIALLFIVGFFLMPKEKGNMQAFDVKGNTLFVGALVAFNLLLSRGVKSGNAFVMLSLFVVTVLLFYGFYLLEKQRESANQPVIFSRKLWKNSLYRQGMLTGIVTGFVMSLFVFLPSMIEVSFHVDARKAGSFLTLMAIGTLLGAKIAGIWTEKRGAMRATKAALVSVSVSLILLFIGHSSFGIFLGALVIFGVAIGMLMTVPLQVLVVEASPKDRNISLSLLSIAKKIGMVVGTTVISLFAMTLPLLGLKPMLGLLFLCTLVTVALIGRKES